MFDVETYGIGRSSSVCIMRDGTDQVLEVAAESEQVYPGRKP